MIYSAEELLNEREARVQRQNALMQRYNLPLVFIKVNYPGIYKNNRISVNIFNVIYDYVLMLMESRIQIKKNSITAEGPTATLILRGDPIYIKKLSVRIEDEHLLGRCVDIDVYNNITGFSISRKQLGIGPRKCFICDEMAQICTRTQTHEVSQIIKYLEKSFKNYLEKDYEEKL